jgi:inner membrane protein
VKHRGIYKAVVYNDKATVKGSFNVLDISKLNIPNEVILWDQAYLSIHIPDLRGIKSQVVINWNGQPIELNPGIADNDIIIRSYNQHYNVDRYNESPDVVTEVASDGSQTSSGLSAKIALNGQQKIDFDFILDLRGSSSLNFIPIGKETNVEMRSNYTTPSFDGAFITDTNYVNEKGFWAKWKVLHLNRNFPQAWTNNAYDINNASFGVNLLVPVDHYQKTMRSAKYAIMFILLTFLVFLFTELLNGFKIHPVQYLLVGLALIIFYTLLLSISEQVGFTWAYILSSSAIIILISLYSRTIFKENRLMALLAGILIILYGFLFVILRSEDYALLIGSIGLFIVLCVVMYLSRKIKWYGDETKEQLS